MPSNRGMHLLSEGVMPLLSHPKDCGPSYASHAKLMPRKQCPEQLVLLLSHAAIAAPAPQLSPLSLALAQDLVSGAVILIPHTDIKQD